MSIRLQPITLTRGDTQTLTLTVESPEDLTTATSIRMTFKRRETDTDADLIFQLTLTHGITVNNATTATITIASTDWDTCDAGTLVYDIERINASSTKTLVMGTATVRQDITRNAP